MSTQPSSCVGEKGIVPVFTAPFIVDLTMCCSFTTLYLYVTFSNAGKPPATPPAISGTYRRKVCCGQASFGLGASSVLMLLCSMGLLITGPKVILFLLLSSTAQTDVKSAEFACQLSGWSIGTLIFEALFMLMSSLMLLTGSLRTKTSYHLAQAASTHLEAAAPANKDDRVTMLMLGVFRGVWVAPFVEEFLKHHRNTDIIAADAYGTPFLNGENDAWIRHNLQIEGVADRVRIGWTNFVSLAFPDASFDVVTVPIGLKLPYINASRESRTRKEKKSLALLREIFRVLKPGGKLIASNFVLDAKTWMDYTAKCGFVEKQSLDRWFWISFIPSRLFIHAKPDAPPSTTSGAGQVPTAASGNDELLSLLAPSQVDVSEFTTFPPGKHYRARDAILLGFFCLYGAYVAITYAVVTSLLQPSFLPWSVSFASLLTGNASNWPFIIYFLATDLTRVARGEELSDEEKRRSRASLRFKRNSSKKSSALSAPLLTTDINEARVASVNTPAVLRKQHEEERMHAVLRHSTHALWQAFLGFTVIPLVFWLPGFLFDLILCKAFNITDFATMDNYSGIFLPIFYFLLMQVGSRVYKCVQARLDLKLSKEEAEDEKALLLTNGNGNDNDNSGILGSEKKGSEEV